MTPWRLLTRRLIVMRTMRVGQLHLLLPRSRPRDARRQTSNAPFPFRVASAASQRARRGQRIAHTCSTRVRVRLPALPLQARIAAPPALAFLRRLALR